MLGLIARYENNIRNRMLPRTGRSFLAIVGILWILTVAGVQV